MVVICCTDSLIFFTGYSNAHEPRFEQESRITTLRRILFLAVVVGGFDIGCCVCNTVDFKIPIVVYTGAVIAEALMSVFRHCSLLECNVPNKSQIATELQ